MKDGSLILDKDFIGMRVEADEYGHYTGRIIAVFIDRDLKFLIAEDGEARPQYRGRLHVRLSHGCTIHVDSLK